MEKIPEVSKGMVVINEEKKVHWQLWDSLQVLEIVSRFFSFIILSVFLDYGRDLFT